MPRHGDNIDRTPNGGWKVKFKIKHTTQQDDGTAVTAWKDRSRTFESKDEARTFKREIENTAAAGKVWRDEREVAVATLGMIATAYNKAASAAPAATQRWRASLMTAWIRFSGAETSANALTLTLLERYADALPSFGRKAASRHRKILEVERMWRWARKRPDLFPGVGEPMEITGRDAGAVRAPASVVRMAAPTFADIDALILHLRPGWRYGDLHRRIALLLRYTGMRISQAIGLRWDDVRLDHASGAHVVLKPGRVGAKRGLGRAIPLHAALVREMRGWGSTGPVFNPDNPGGTWTDGEATRTAFRTAWMAAGVPRDRWDVTDAERESGERAHGSPCHAIRAGLKVELIRRGASEAIADYLIGHTKGATSMAYVPEWAPDNGAYWPRLLDAVATIPAHPREAFATRGATGDNGGAGTRAEP